MSSECMETQPYGSNEVLRNCHSPERTTSGAHYVAGLVCCGGALLLGSVLGGCELLAPASAPGCVAVLSGCAAAVLPAEAPSATEAPPPASRLFGTVSKSSIIWE
jgi:hypothetical protein